MGKLKRGGVIVNLPFATRHHPRPNFNRNEITRLVSLHAKAIECEADSNPLCAEICELGNGLDENTTLKEAKKLLRLLKKFDSQVNFWTTKGKRLS